MKRVLLPPMNAPRYPAYRPRRAAAKGDGGFGDLLFLQLVGVLLLLLGAMSWRFLDRDSYLENRMAFLDLLGDVSPVERVSARLQQWGEPDGKEGLPLGEVDSSYSKSRQALAGGIEVMGQGGEHQLEPSPEEELEPPNGTTFAPVYVTAKPILPLEQFVVTSPFGYREHPITDKLDFHTGLDLAAALGSDIHAVYPGTVVEVGKSSISGNYVILSHGNIKTMYCHCHEILVEAGTRVRQGERIALVGSTGVSTGPHLHFEFWVDEIKTDPAWVLELDQAGGEV